MTLTEAIATGKKIKRADNEFSFVTPSTYEYTFEDVTASDWIIEPDAVVKTLTLNDLKAAWERARSGMVSVKSADESRLFNNLKAVLFDE